MSRIILGVCAMLVSGFYYVAFTAITRVPVSNLIRAGQLAFPVVLFIFGLVLTVQGLVQ